MNFEYASRINPFLEQLNFAKAIQTAEAELQKLPASEYHQVLGKSLTYLAGGFADWVEDFYTKSSEKIHVNALYFEMNEFDINTDLWYIDCFAFKKDGGLDADDMDWLSDFDTNSQDETETVFALDDYELVQRAFELSNSGSDESQDAKDWSEQIIIARFMELVRAAHIVARDRGLGWAKVPVYFTEHGYDFVVKAEND